MGKPGRRINYRKSIPAGRKGLITGKDNLLSGRSIHGKFPAINLRFPIPGAGAGSFRSAYFSPREELVPIPD
jgi:hypothetical protein